MNTNRNERKAKSDGSEAIPSGFSIKLINKKVSQHISSSFSMSTISSFRGIENKHDVYRGKDYNQTFC